MSHPDEGLIHEWLDGELDAAEAARVEALVASDPAWAAAAAEARGLIAASSRIVRSLDRVPANVIPKSGRGSPRPTRTWAWRAAAVLALMAGTAVVLKRGGPPELPDRAARQVPAAGPVADAAPVPAPQAAAPTPKPVTPARQGVVSAAPHAAPTPKVQPAVPANAPAFDAKKDEARKELDVSKQLTVRRDKDAAGAAPSAKTASTLNALGTVRAAREAGAPAAEQRVAPAASPAPIAGGNALQQTTERLTRLQASCYETREPRDAAPHIIRLDAAALADSIRLERLALHGDTLAAVHGTLIAIRVPCPAP